MEIKLPKYAKNGAVIILAILIAWMGGYVFFTVVELDKSQALMKDDIADANDDLKVVVERLGKIVERLPDAGIYIAREEIQKPVDAVLVTTLPQQVGDIWKIYAIILNGDASEHHIYTAHIDGPDDYRAAYMTIGAVDSIGPRSRTFAEMAGWSMEMNQVVAFSTAIDPKVSFVFRERLPNSFFDRFFELFGDPVVLPGSRPDTSWATTVRYANDHAMNSVDQIKLIQLDQKQ